MNKENLELVPHTPHHTLALIEGPELYEKSYGIRPAEGLRDFFVSTEVSSVLAAERPGRWLKADMAEKASNISVILIVLLALGSHALAESQAQPPFGDLITPAEAVVAVEILSTDYGATPADGPMVATAKVLKSLKGPLTLGKQFRFSETAWVGPSYQKGEYRILFLEKAAPSVFPRLSEWRILSRLDARTDFFIEKDSVSNLSLESLGSFLKKLQESKSRPKKVIFGKGSMN